ncbi:NUDIX domain-containing protein [Streptomyces sp. NPDC055642]
MPLLRGGTVEATESTPEDSVHREAAEEAQLTVAGPVRLGLVLDEPARSTAAWDSTPGSAFIEEIPAEGMHLS